MQMLAPIFETSIKTVLNILHHSGLETSLGSTILSSITGVTYLPSASPTAKCQIFSRKLTGVNALRPVNELIQI